MEKLDVLIKWINLFHDKTKASVLMNGSLTGFVASKIAIKIFGKENVVNIISPCYSTTDYMIESATFSNNIGVKHKDIGLKYIYDSIIDDADEDIDLMLVDHLRSKIMSSVSFKNDSVVFEFVKRNDNYEFKIFFIDKNLQENTYISEITFSEDEIKEINGLL